MLRIIKTMKKLLILTILIDAFTSTTLAQEKLLVNTYNRQTTSLKGYWKYIVDPYENGYYNYRYQPFDQQENPASGAFYTNSKPKHKSDLIEYDFDKSDSILVPGDWNTQKEKLYFYEGTIWYKKSFDYTKSKPSNRLFVYFGSSNYQAEVYFNGKKLGTHTGGFTPFNFEISSLVKEKDNFLIVKVDNKRKKEGVPTLNTDWWNYGGITRDVNLVELSETYISDYFIALDQNDSKKINGKVVLKGNDISSRKVEVAIPELGLNEVVQTNEQGIALLDIKSKKIKYWSVDNPHLYKISIKTDTDEIEEQIGFRTIRTAGSNILLNGEEIFLRGISIHEEKPGNGGRGLSREDARQLLLMSKELGCNFVRLAHYPHNEHMVRLADQMGILVWEENPVYWTIDWENEATFLNAKNQLTELISRDKNRASVIIWSMANETPKSVARIQFLNRLAEHTREMDPTRLISAALEQSNFNGDHNIRTINDPFAEVVDILSFNQYIGWYDGLPDKCSTISWVITQDKPVIISEFGAGAKYGLHGDKDTRWTEEFQANLYEETLKMIDKIDQLRGISPWILMDFRSPRRMLPKIQDGWNRKGLVSEDGNKKKAFYVLKEYYEAKRTQ